MKAFATESGRKELYPYTMGIIKSVMSDKTYTADEKVLQIERTLLLLDTVWNDEELPWDIEREKDHAANMVLEKIELAKSNTDRWLMEEILRSVG